MELLTIKELGKTSRMPCSTCGELIRTRPAEVTALRWGEGIEPRQCRKCKPKAVKKRYPRNVDNLPKVSCPDCGKERLKQRGLTDNDPCLRCKTDLPKYWKHGEHEAYKKGCRCQVCKDGMARRAREHRIKYKDKHGVAYKNKRKSRGYEKVCQNPACKGTFYSPDKRKIVCGDACSFEKRKHDRLSSLAPVLYDKAFAETQRKPRTAPTNYIKGTGGVWYVGDCAWCGEGFTRMSWSDPTQCCSAWCSRRLSNESNPHFRKWKRWISDRRRYALYQRDGWVCQICHVKCSDTYDPHDPLSPTLDHIIPKSKFAEGDQYMHDDMNLRTAHASCNTDRFLAWDRSGWVSLLVILGELDVKTARELRVERAVHTIREEHDGATQE